MPHSNLDIHPAHKEGSTVDRGYFDNNRPSMHGIRFVSTNFSFSAVAERLIFINRGQIYYSETGLGNID